MHENSDDGIIAVSLLSREIMHAVIYFNVSCETFGPVDTNSKTVKTVAGFSNSIITIINRVTIPLARVLKTRFAHFTDARSLNGENYLFIDHNVISFMAVGTASHRHVCRSVLSTIKRI